MITMASLCERTYILGLGKSQNVSHRTAHILVCAKFETGYDNPNLSFLYILGDPSIQNRRIWDNQIQHVR